MDILREIMLERKAAVMTAREAVAAEKLQEAATLRVHHSLVHSLRSGTATRIIAEAKKASPSAGLLRAHYDPALLAAGYKEAGAIGISVLTEPNHFQGSGEHLRAVRERVNLPILRKDFICDPYQIYEAAAWGADVVLLIAAALDRQEMLLLYREALELGLEVLAEVHNEEELVRIMPLEQAIIGVNNRNLQTLHTSLDTSRQLASLIPDDRVCIAESGIKTRADIEDLERHGYHGFLVGESLLRQDRPADALRALI